MKITLLVVSPTELSYLKEGIKIYTQKLVHYFPFVYEEIPACKQTKHLNFEQIKQKEGEIIFKKISDNDTVILLDERGKGFTSVEFSQYLQNSMLQNIKNLTFVIGGAYGFSEKVYQRANGKIALSKMTFSHQMVRLIFLEQLYRAASILKNEPYHHV
jgi:23S rRNA (pseudouridine1915-N3)-methyltransferase